MALDIDDVFRDNKIKGDIHSGAHDVDKPEVRALLKSLFGAAANPSVVKQTKAALDLVTPASEAYGGLVLNDSDPTKNGYYYRSSSAWVKGRGFPDTFAALTLAGTGTAQTATVAAGVNPADVLVYFAAVVTANTGSMTLAIAGGAARDVVNAAGNALSAGEWTGTVLFFLNGDGEYQLLFDAGAVAAAAASATNAAASAAAAAAFSLVEFDDLADLVADNNAVVGYAASGATVIVTAGFRIRAGGWRYEVAASSANAYSASTDTDGYHLITAGGVKLFVLPGDDGTYNANAFGVTADGTTDDTVKLRLAIEFAGAAGLSLGKAGTIRVTSSIERFGDLRIKNPNGAKIYGDTGTYSTDAVLKVTGTKTQVQDLSANVSRGGVTLTGAGTWPFAPSEIGMTYNPADGSFVNIPGRGYYRAGEFFECMDTPTTVMNLRNPLYAAYLAASVDVYKITPVLVQIDDIVMEGSASPLNLLHIELGKDVAINRPRMKHLYDACIVLDQCFGSTVDTPMINNKGAGNPGDYGIVIANCQKWTILAPDMYSRRHPITTGGYDKVGCVPVRAGRIIGGTLRNDQASGATCGDFHGNTEDCEYVDVTIYGGASYGGKNNSYRGCRIRGGVSSGPAFLASELVGGVYSLFDNEMELYADPEPNGRGFIDIGGNSVVLDSTVAEDVTIRIRGNTFKSSALSANTNLVYGGNVGTTKNVNIEVSGNVFDVNNFSSVLRLYRSSGTAASQFLIVDENICALSGKYSIYPDGDYSALNALRCQASRWSESVTTSTGASFKAGTNTDFKWRFPRTPAIIAGRTGIGYIGDKLGVPYVATLDFAGATLAIGTDSGANFSSASAVTLTGEAAIRQV